MKSILFVSEYYHPFKGGVPIVVKYLAEGMAKKGFRVTVATSIPKNSSLNQEEVIEGVFIKRFFIWRNIAKFIRGDIQRFQSFVLTGNFDFVILECGQSITTDALLPIIERINGIKIIHAHGLSGQVAKAFVFKDDFKHTIGNTYNWLRMKWYYNITFKNACPFFDASISLTETDTGYSYLSKNIANNYILGNAADDIFFNESLYQSPLNIERKTYLISIANYSVIKDQINLLRQFYLIDRKDVALVMIGSSENSYYKRVLKENRKLAAQFGARKVYILTRIDRCFFPIILENALVYLTTSTREEFSISIIEAMARGVPFISTNVGNARLLPGGITIDRIDDFHIVISKLLNDEDRMDKLGKEAKEYAYNNCRIETVVDKLVNIINTISEQ